MYSTNFCANVGQRQSAIVNLCRASLDVPVNKLCAADHQ